MATKKATKKEVTVDFSNSIEKIKGTAKTVNNEVLTTATEVLEDLRTNGEKIREAATESVNKAIETMTIKNGVKLVKETAKNINEFGLETAETVLDSAVKGGKKWQGVADKAVKAGLAMNERNQEIAFDTLESLKEQLGTGVKRFRGLFSTK